MTIQDYKKAAVIFRQFNLEVSSDKGMRQREFKNRMLYLNQKLREQGLRIRAMKG